MDDGVLANVEIHVDGERHLCPTGIQRRDVGRYFRDPRLDRSGWRFEHRLDPDRAEVWVAVSARSERDERALLYAGPLSNPGENHR